MKKSSVFALAIGAQVLFLGALVAREEVARASGTRVVLEVRAYDPMDPFAGRYVRVPLAIERIELAAVAHDEPPPAYGAEAYVELAPGEPCWKPVAVHAEPKEGAVCARGRVTSFPAMSRDTLVIDFDADRFFISEDAHDPSLWQWMIAPIEGVGPSELRLERPELSVVARVTRAGRIAVDDLLVGGRSFAEWNRAQPAGK